MTWNNRVSYQAAILASTLFASSRWEEWALK